MTRRGRGDVAKLVAMAMSCKAVKELAELYPDIPLKLEEAIERNPAVVNAVCKADNPFTALIAILSAIDPRRADEWAARVLEEYGEEIAGFVCKLIRFFSGAGNDRVASVAAGILKRVAPSIGELIDDAVRLGRDIGREGALALYAAFMWSVKMQFRSIYRQLIRRAACKE